MSSGSTLVAFITAELFSPPLLLISMTFLWELECNDGTNVGLAAGRYSGNSLPDLNRTPQALQRLFGPIGPALHCGVLVIWQCMHFLTDCAGGWVGFVSTGGASGSDNFTFFFFLCSAAAAFGILFIGSDSTKFSDSEEVGEMSWITERGLKVAGRGRLLRARWRPSWVEPMGTMAFSPELEELLLLLLSRTETGLEVLNWLWEGSFLSVEFCCSRVMPPSEKESSMKFESHSRCTTSSYWKGNRKPKKEVRWRIPKHSLRIHQQR